MVASALSGVNTVALAKAEHSESWLGRFHGHLGRYPGAAVPPSMIFFDRKDPAQLLRILEGVRSSRDRAPRSLLIHVEGTRALRARRPVGRLSSAVLDFAIAGGLAIVPVRFAGGLPLDDAPARLEFPVGYGRQDILFGRPILPAELEKLAYADRVQHVLTALNRGVGDELPAAPDPEFVTAVKARMGRTGVTEPHAVLGCLLDGAAELSADGRTILAALRTGRLDVQDDARGRWLADMTAWLTMSAGR
jgi:hypothetical protein